MLILYCSDSHITGKNPIARRDNLVKIQFNKWKELVSIANYYDVPILHGGDVFNVPILANSILTEFGNIIDKLKSPLYFVWGNHDLMYHSIDMLDRTSLGVLWSNNHKIKHISEFQKDYNYQFDWWDWNEPLTNNNSKFLLSHKAMVSEKDLGKNSWIANDEDFCAVIENNEKLLHNYKLILCGHWHHRYIFNYKGIKIINSGPLIRRTVEEQEIPVIYLINLETLFAKRIPLRSAKSSELVLSNSHLLKKTSSIKNDITEFINKLRSKKFKTTSSLLTNLINILDSHELEPFEENLLRDILSKVMSNKENKV